MPDKVLQTTLDRLIDEQLLENQLTISWHGAEPLAAGLSWYERAFERINATLPKSLSVSHVFQSNGVLINAEWCAMLKQHPTHIGVSLDGSAAQNEARVNWAGRPMYRASMRGIDALNSHNIPWTLLSVITLDTMKDPDGYIKFVKASGCSTLGFKIEETNVAHHSRLSGSAEVARLYGRFAQALWEAFPPDGIVKVREFEEYRSARQGNRRRQVVPVTLVPFRNLTVAVDGSFTIFAGELLFRDDNDFVFGNVLDGPLLECLTSNRFRNVSEEMLLGVQRCARECSYYSHCGAFYTSQKHAETGTFDAGETLACRLEVKTMFDYLDLLQ